MAKALSDPHGEGLLGEGLLAVDGEVADLEDLVLVAGAAEHQPDQLHQDEGDEGRPEDDPDGRPELLPQLVGRARVHEAVHPERARTCRAPSGRCAWLVAITCPLAVRWPQPYSIMFGSPKMPSSMPPRKPAMPWV